MKNMNFWKQDVIKFRQHSPTAQKRLVFYKKFVKVRQMQTFILNIESAKFIVFSNSKEYFFPNGFNPWLPFIRIDFEFS
jgi:hypothetical protein